MDKMVSQEHQDKQDNKELWDHKELQDLKVHLVHLE